MSSYHPRDEQAAKSQRVVTWGLLSLCVAAALAMRLWQARESLWLDELHTAWVVSGDWQEIAARAKAGNQPPLYFYLIAAGARLGGMNELTLRFPSILAGVALVPLCYAVVRRWSGSAAAGLAAAAIAALDRDFLFYATEARVYALIQLFALVRLAAFFDLFTVPTSLRRSAYISLAALMFHLHYTTALVWLGEAACVGLWAWRVQPSAKAQYGARRFLIDSLLILLLMLPAAPHVWEVFQRRENWASFVPIPTLTKLTVEKLAPRATQLIVYLTPALVVLLAAVIHQRRLRSKPDQPAEVRHLVMGMLAWIVIPVAAAWLLTRSDVARLFLYRYLIASAAAAPLLAGMLCGLSPTKGRRIAAAAMTVLAASIYVVPGYVTEVSRSRRLIADRNEDWRGAVAELNRSDDRLPVLLYAGLIETRAYAESPDPLLRDYCLLPVQGIYRLGDDRLAIPLVSLNAAELRPDACQSIVLGGGAWMLLRLPEASAAAAIRRSEQLASRCGRRARLLQSTTFGGVTAARFTVE